MKKTILLIFLFLFALPVFSTEFLDYKVPNTVPLNQDLTIYGKYAVADIWCSFYLLDLNNSDSNGAVMRLDDIQTFSDGSFFAKQQITEPLFRRGMDYNAITKCGTIEIGQQFRVEQKEEIAFGITPEALRLDLQFWTRSENSLTIVVFFAMLIFVLGVAVFLVRRASIF